MKHGKWKIGICLCVVLAVGCAAPRRGLFPPEPGAPVKTVHVISHGWHTGIALSRAEFVGTDRVMEREFGGDADYLEFGWGDAAYYPTDRPTVGMSLKALFWPTPSVLRVVAVRGTLTNAFAGAEIIPVELSEPGFERLRCFVARTFRRDAKGDLMRVKPEFYEAEGKFYFPKMCNWWAASALREAGCPIAPGCCVSAGCVAAQARRFRKAAP